MGKLIAALIIAVIVTTACAWVLTGPSQARADLQNYLKGPNLFYPGGHDRPGPVNLTIQTVGWNATRLAGNLGIGNGSVRTFDRTHTYDVEYPENEFMCGDVSAQPWIPGLKTQAPQVEATAEEQATGEPAGEAMGEHSVPGENVTGTASSPDVNRYALPAIGQNATAGAGNKTYNLTGEKAVNESARKAANVTNKTAPLSKEQAAAVNENQTYQAYHPIQFLDPVKDVMYEHPLSTSGTTYCQLLGFVPPSGNPINVGMKCTGYGY